MSRVILIPLEDEYEIVNIRTTTLESFDNCAYAFKFWEGYKPKDVEKQLQNQHDLQLGNLVHEVMQTHAMSKDKCWALYPIIDMQLKDMYWDNKKQYDLSTGMIENLLNCMERYYEHNIYNVIWCELKLQIEIECWKILLILTGSADALSYVDGLYSVIDWKTAKTEYKLEDITEKIQRYVYTYILGKTFWFENLKWFDYLGITKHILWPRHFRNPIYMTTDSKWEPCPWDWMIQNQSMPYYIDVSQEEITSYVEDLILRYVTSITTNIRPATPIKERKVGEHIAEVDTKMCIRCSLKRDWKCPAFNQQPTFDNILDDIF